jgi:hypothetical protein
MNTKQYAIALEMATNYPFRYLCRHERRGVVYNDGSDWLDYQNEQITNIAKMGFNSPNYNPYK